MPAENFVATPELRFVERLPPQPPLGTSDSDVNAVYLQRKQRILQQKWVIVGTYWHQQLDDENSEWRDVPLVTEGG